MQDKTQLLIWRRGLFTSSRTVRQCNLDELQPLELIGLNNITVPVKKGGRLYGWLTAEENVYKNHSITYFNDSIDNSIRDAEGNTCGIIAIPSIERTFDNDHIYVLHDLTNQYIYG